MLEIMASGDTRSFNKHSESFSQPNTVFNSKLNSIQSLLEF